MAIKKILVPLSGRYNPDDPQSLDKPALKTAARLVRHLDAQAEVLSVVGPSNTQATGWVSWVPDYGVDAVLDAMERQGEIRRKNIRKSYESLVQPDVDAGQLRASLIEKRGELEATVGAAGRLSDLIVVASSEVEWEQPFRPILDVVLRQTGRPVFVSPLVAPEKTGENVVIAWNDTSEAARALSGAMTFLKRAKSVTVLTGRDGDGPAAHADPEAVAEYLGLHGVTATSRTFVSEHRKVGQEIIDTARGDGADLLVLGSVMHSRAHSLVYGSLTEEVLKAPKLSALLVP